MRTAPIFEVTHCYKTTDNRENDFVKCRNPMKETFFVSVKHVY